MTMRFNGTELEEVRFNGVDCEKVYFNGVLVFEKVIEPTHRSWIEIALDPRNSSIRGCDVGYPFGDTNGNYNWAFTPGDPHLLRGVTWGAAGIKLLWFNSSLTASNKLTVRIGPVSIPNVPAIGRTPLTTQQLNALNALGLSYQPLDLSL